MDRQKQTSVGEPRPSISNPRPSATLLRVSALGVLIIPLGSACQTTPLPSDAQTNGGVLGDSSTLDPGTTPGGGTGTTPDDPSSLFDDLSPADLDKGPPPVVTAQGDVCTTNT